MPTATFNRGFSAAHRVWNDPGKCHNVHGHNYTAEIEVSLIGKLTPQNFVVAFDAIKTPIDDYDHTLILDYGDPMADVFVATGLEVRFVPGPPSTELMARTLAERILAACELHNPGATSITVRVSLRETASIEASASVTWIK